MPLFFQHLRNIAVSVRLEPQGINTRRNTRKIKFELVVAGVNVIDGSTGVSVTCEVALLDDGGNVGDGMVTVEGGGVGGVCG